MSYFTEVEDFKTYQDKEEDFHFIYNGNTGGGQSFLGGKYRDEGGNLASPMSLNGRIGIFRFKVGDRNDQHDVLMDDDSVSYEIKPRAEGDSNMKLSVGDKPTPSVMIATFLMLPKPCGIKRTSDINTSVLNGNNFWLQSMWLSVDASHEGKAILTPKDCVICGGVDKLGQGVARYFRINFEQRISDIIRVADANELEDDVQVCIKHFADIYKGVKPFVYDESAEAIKRVMRYLSSKYPERYSGTLDPLSVIKELVCLSEPSQIAGTVRSDVLAAIRTKPFILLAGISGTGKSRIVRHLARGCCPETKDGQPHPLRDEQKPGNFELIPVRPNWHDSTELMGYVTRITGTGKPKYMLTPFVKFLVKAWLHKDVPFFLCLDEMNLAPVEQYFAEYLSKIETRKLSDGEIVTDVLVEFNDEVCESAIEELLKPYKPAAGSPIPPEVTTLENAMKADKGIRIPPNLVVMGTVNMDETTCSFSRKVLDRAMSFELNDVDDMYTISTEDDPKVGWGAFNNGVVNRAKQTYVTAENLYAETDVAKKAANMAVGGKVLEYLKEVNAVLDKTPFKVAYRTRNEMMLYCVERGGDLAKALDEVTSMKILSRIEGDENAVRVTNKLVESAAVVPTPLPNDAPKNLIQLLKRVILKQLGVVDGTIANAAAVPSSQEYDALEGKYKICAAKLDEMDDRLLSGYTGFWR